MEKENFIIKMGIYSKENLKIIKKMEKGFIISLMERKWWENLKVVKKMDYLNYI